MQEFANYCRYVAEQLGDLMHYVCTIHEANMGLQIAAISRRYLMMMQKNQDKARSSAENSVWTVTP